MLEAGFTRVGEFHYLHHDRDGRPYARSAEMAARIAAAAGETGIGLTCCRSSTRMATSAARPPHRGQRRFISDLDGFARLIEAMPRGRRPSLDGADASASRRTACAP